MATLSATRAKHATLVAATVDTVTLGANYARVEIFNRSSSGYIYATTNGTTPTSGGDDTYVIGPGQAIQVDTPSPTATVVKLICATANDYSVTGL